jgi:hypothetical protein
LAKLLFYGWRVTVRCAAGKQDGRHRHKECVYRAELDMETLAWTRGRIPHLALGNATALSDVRFAGDIAAVQHSE